MGTAGTSGTGTVGGSLMGTAGTLGAEEETISPSLGDKSGAGVSAHVLL